MRRLLLSLTIFAATVPLDFACSNKDEDPSKPVGDGDGDIEIPVSMGGAPGDSCESFAGLSNCDQQGEEAKKVDANLLLVIDKSGSMDDTGGFADTKWEVMRQALNTALDEVKYDINFGLSLYPFPDNPLVGISKETCGEVGNCCEMPTETEPNIGVAPGIDTVPLILDEFIKVNPGGGTPTAVALAHAYDYFVYGSGKDLEGDKFVVLATDGGPNCNDELQCDSSSCTLNIEERSDSCTPETDTCCVGNTGRVACLDDLATLQAVETLAAAGIDTFVIGVPGSEFYSDMLDDLAEEGGRALEGEERKYFQVEGADGVDALTDVFRTITRELVTSCEIPLTSDSGSLVEINVAVDCEIVPRYEGATSGGGAGGGGGASGEEVANWSVDAENDPPLVILHGDLCERVEKGVERVDVVLGCPSVY